MKTLATIILLVNASCAYNMTRIKPLEAGATYYYTPPVQTVLVNQYGQPVAAPAPRHDGHHGRRP